MQQASTEQTSPKLQVLLIAYHFPPSISMASLRMARLVRGMLDAEIDLDVIARKESHAWSPDQALIDRIAGVRSLTRTRSVEPRRSSGGTVSPSSMPKFSLKARLRPLVSQFLTRYVFIPDSAIGWIPFGVMKAVSIGRKRRPDLVVASVPPMSAGIVGALTAWWLGVPLALEYRDSLSDFSTYGARYGWLRTRTVTRLERWLLSRATRIVTLSQALAIDVENKLGVSSAGHVATVYNCFDPEDVVESPPDRDRIVLVHAGNLTEARDTSALMRGIAIFLDTNPQLRSRFVLRLIGKLHRDVHSAAELHGVPVEFTGVIPYSEIPDQLARAHVLLVVKNPRDLLHIPGKLFEAAGARRPILLIGDSRSEAAQLIREHRLGIAADHDPETVARALGQLLSGSNTHTPSSSFELGSAASFSRAAIASQFASQLKLAVNGVTAAPTRHSVAHYTARIAGAVAATAARFTGFNYVIRKLARWLQPDHAVICAIRHPSSEPKPWRPQSPLRFNQVLVQQLLELVTRRQQILRESQFLEVSGEQVGWVLAEPATLSRYLVEPAAERVRVEEILHSPALGVWAADRWRAGVLTPWSDLGTLPVLDWQLNESLASFDFRWTCLLVKDVLFGRLRKPGTGMQTETRSTRRWTRWIFDRRQITIGSRSLVGLEPAPALPPGFTLVEIEPNSILIIGRDMGLTWRKLRLFQQRLRRGSRGFAVRDPSGRYCYTTWYETGPRPDPEGPVQLEIAPNEVLLLDSYCAPTHRGIGLHRVCNLHRLHLAASNGIVRAYVAFLSENEPARRVQLVSSGLEVERTVVDTLVFRRRLWRSEMKLRVS